MGLDESCCEWCKTDIIALGKAAKAVKAAPTAGMKVWGAVKELFSPGLDDAITSGIDYKMGEEPDLSWLTGLIPIYGTYQASVYANSEKPIKEVFVDI